MPDTTRSAEPSETTESSRPEISICETSPGKTVFLEADNSDGWIATDLTVDLKR